ncbi:MAG: LacI family DNA-binding transcriptional regulator [Anaerolineae bacterium]|nr:LacI family DNA-binding transcriptional regulator [Anaerolineae bacterium]
MPKSVSLKDVARAAGVSASTVSRALYYHPRARSRPASGSRPIPLARCSLTWRPTPARNVRSTIRRWKPA